MNRPTEGGAHGYPGGARFAFTILDDTDDSTLENARPVYERLHELGFRTTKTVWPLDCPEGSRNFFAADTLERPEYLAWVHELVDAGFELGMHGATMESSPRERTERGLDRIRREFGAVPRIYANHGFNQENLYWGAERFHSRWLRALMGRFSSQQANFFEGQSEGSDYYWGDLCQEHVEYVRGFTSTDLNVERFDPLTPYHLDDTPCVRFWFSTADAPDATTFKRQFTISALDRLEAEGGICILSTHLGKGFAPDGRLDPEVDEILTGLSKRDGWFAPVSDVLDHMRARRTRDDALTSTERSMLELRFCRRKLTERLGGIFTS